MTGGRAEEKAVYVTFDESPTVLQGYIEGRGRSADHLTFIDFRIDPDVFRVGGEIDLAGMLIQIELAMKKTKARKLVLDALDVLLDQMAAPGVTRDVLRLLQWCRDKHYVVLMTAGVDADYQEGTGFLDYASDVVIRLYHDMDGLLMTRMLRVLKYRGRSHGTNEYPFIIDENGVSVIPVTGVELDTRAPRKRLSTGITELDRMLGGRGIWRNSTLQISGQSGTGKSLLASHIVAHACASGLKVLYLSFEESPAQITRNLGTIGLKIRPLIDSGQLVMESRNAAEFGLENHIIRIAKLVDNIKPDVVVLDPVTSLVDIGNPKSFKSMVIRLRHFLLGRGITLILTELLRDNSVFSDINVSSIVDTWIRLRIVETDHVFKRLIHVHKSRGARISMRAVELTIGTDGLAVIDPDKVSRA